MPAVFTPRRSVQLFVVPLVAAFCMAFIIGAIVLDREGADCPSPTWNNQLHLQLAPTSAKTVQPAAVTACMGEECVPLAPAFAKASSGTTRALIHERDGSWQLSLGAQPAGTISFTVYDKNGAVLSNQSTKVNWTRISGNERCGGAMADVNMVLDMP